MSMTRIPAGYLPLTDAAPLIAAQEMGFAAEERLTLDLHRAPSWSSLRDMLAFGKVDAAQMLAPVPVAAALGLGGASAPFSVLSVLSVNGTVIGVSNSLSRKMAEAGHRFSFDDAVTAGKALIAAAGPDLRIGVPFPFSMHTELLTYWLRGLGPETPRGISILTVPPPRMAEAIKRGEIDAFCVGEPWGSIAVEQGSGTLLLPGRAIWSFAPEKVLAVRSGWAETEPGLSGRLIRALWRAGRWLADPASRGLAAEILSSRRYLDLPAEIIERALSGKFTVSAQGLQRDALDFIGFHNGAAGFPWRSQAQWIALQLAERNGLDRQAALETAGSVFRSDLYRAALRGTGAKLPGASSKLEGAITAGLQAAGESETVSLLQNRFFDGRVFDPLAAD
ncbi:CmpA/NrtA family ABC transporter substrate-binding protein [Leisingera sp. McT4-56]|uniref:CmpA/NrtA family ABC transporter substrate-binding protein n=1 Tax=Leisingera sp. McT4-56 TaxID=2881255 RepID=UPI001CF7FB10|nr:CmpA/NrtA family ABC transporter substrate-binding protein [Leisingera sp. McT4-56]MCB4458134.1 ABC transporter substrate-binding protein [Leisingera sp. McT4-56]